ncbi:MAG: polysaccharide deacetylase family protein [Phycisphaerae bacterium]|nr:polysaccharide deacetylase family protein [Phycisphaerae bacterium]
MLAQYVKKIACVSRLPASLRLMRKSGPVIVTYHGVIADENWRDWETADMVAESVFCRHLDFYSKHYNVVPLRRIADVLKGQGQLLPPRALAITFDDGYRNNLQYAVPVLKKHGFAATFFLTTGFLDGSTDLWWLPLKRCILMAQDQRQSLNLRGFGQLPVGSREQAGQSYRKALGLLKGLCGDERARVLDELQQESPGARDVLGAVYAPLTWSEARELQQQDMEIGAHTVTHPILAREVEERSKREIFDSVQRIRKELSLKEIPFSYPNGQREDFTEDIEDMVREAGCYAAVAGFPGPNKRTDQIYLLRRYPIGGYHTVASLELDLCGLRSAIKSVVGIFRKGFQKDE